MLDPKDLRRTVVIENVAPAVDGGRYPIKREVGDRVEVSADIFKEGHDVPRGLREVPAGRRARLARERRCGFVDNDRWAGAFTVEDNARYRFTIEALPDPFRSWLADLAKRVDAGQDVASELREGAALVRGAAGRATGADAAALGEWLARIEKAPSQAEAVAAARRGGPGGADGSPPRPRRRHLGRARVRGRRRPRARALRGLVRVLPALGRGRPPRHLPRRRGPARAGGGDGLRRRLPAAHPPDRPRPSQGRATTR